MRRTTLRLNAWGKCILGEFDLFDFQVNSIKLKYPEAPDKSNIKQIKFNWQWNGYEGYGELDYYNDTKEVCRNMGEDYSNMTISGKSKRKQRNGRNNCALYNDKSLAELFTIILGIVDFENS